MLIGHPRTRQSDDDRRAGAVAGENYASGRIPSSVRAEVNRECRRLSRVQSDAGPDARSTKAFAADRLLRNGNVLIRDVRDIYLKRIGQA